MTSSEEELEIQQELQAAAGKIKKANVDGVLYIDARTLVEFAATVAATHKHLLKGNELADHQYYMIMGQQTLCATLVALYEALLLRDQTDKALTGE